MGKTLEKIKDENKILIMLAFFMIFQLLLSYLLIYMRKSEEKNKR